MPQRPVVVAKEKKTDAVVNRIKNRTYKIHFSKCEDNWRARYFRPSPNWVPFVYAERLGDI